MSLQLPDLQDALVFLSLNVLVYITYIDKICVLTYPYHAGMFWFTVLKITAQKAELQIHIA